MERSTLIGVASVALGGVALAGLAIWGAGVGGVQASEPVVEAGELSRAEVPAEVPTEVLSDQPSQLEPPNSTARLTPGAGASPPRERLSFQPVEWTEPPDALGEAGLEHLFEDEKELLADDPFADLPPHATPEQVSRRVDSVLISVDRLAGEYESAAAGVEPSDASQVLHRAALLYEHVAGAIPTHPPTTGTPEDHEAWRQRHEATIYRVASEAERLHELARAEAAVPPPVPE